MPEHTVDHDLLIQIDTKLERALVDIKELKDGTTARISALENDKASKSEVGRLNVRITWLERIAYAGIGALWIAEMYFRFFKH